MKISIKTLGLGLVGPRLGLGLAFGLTAAMPASADDDLKMMSGPQGGSWIPLGGQLKDMWEKAVPGLKVQVLPGAGIANVRGVDEGKADIGFGNSISTVDGVAGKKPFPKKATNICNIATLYPQYYQFVVPPIRRQHDRRSQGQGHHHPAARQHRRTDHAPASRR